MTLEWQIMERVRELGETNFILLLRETFPFGDDQIPMRFRSVVVLRESQRFECVVLQPVMCVDGLCRVDALERFSPFFYLGVTDEITARSAVGVVGATA